MRYLTQELLPLLWQEPAQPLFSCPALAVASSPVFHGKYPIDAPSMTPFRTGKGAWQGSVGTASFYGYGGRVKDPEARIDSRVPFSAFHSLKKHMGSPP